MSYEGSAWQARKDTAKSPSAGSPDWALIARHGRDAITPVVRGTFRTDETYVMLDIVEHDGSAWIAKSNYPGVPGHDDNWQLFSKRGAKGRRGETVRWPQGERGDKGDAAREIVSWSYDVANYRATPFATNGTPLPTLDLRPFLERLLAEVFGGL